MVLPFLLKQCSDMCKEIFEKPSRKLFQLLCKSSHPVRLGSWYAVGIFNNAWMYTVNLLVLMTSNCVQACRTVPWVLLPWQQYWPESLVCSKSSRRTWPPIRNVPFETACLPLGTSSAFHHVTFFAHKEQTISAVEPSIIVWCAVMMSFWVSAIN